jgi:hypothetical protein
MALNDVAFNLGQGGLGRPLPGQDHISAMLFYTGTLPSGFSSTDRVKKVFSLEEAEVLGILGDYSDETKATATYTVTTAGTAGETVELKVLEPKGYKSLGVATIPASATTTTSAAAIADIINQGTYLHGYSAVAAVAVVTITARPGLGIFLNTGTPLVSVIAGVGGSPTHAGTTAQFGSGSLVDGVASLQATWHYHISEYFRMQPQGVLYVGMYAVPSTYDFADLATMQQFANGEIHQSFVYCDALAYTSGNAAIQAAQAVCNTLFTNHMPLSTVLLTFNYTAATLSALTTLSGLNSKNVSAVISQDGDAKGFGLFKATGKTISNAGSCLGSISYGKVSDDIAHVGKFNISDGTENNVAAFVNGALVSSQSISLLNNLNTYRYIFCIKKVGYEGTFWNDSHTCVLQSSDYAYIENNRTIDKAVRTLYTAFISDLNGPLVVNSNGTLKDTTIAYFTTKGEEALDQMVRDEELSAKKIIIDPTKNVLTDSSLTIGADLVPIGVSRNIKVNIGYKLSIQ